MASRYDPKVLAIYLLRKIAEHEANRLGPYLTGIAAVLDDQQNQIDTRSVNLAIRWMFEQGWVAADPKLSAHESDDDVYSRYLLLTDRGWQQLAD